VTTHKGLSGGARTIAHLYDMQYDPALREVMTFASPSSGEPVGMSFLEPRSVADLIRRREMVKVARHVAEEGRIAIRNIRRDTMSDLRELKESGDAGSDDERRAEEALQKLTDQRIGEVDSTLKVKEAEILEV